MSRREDRVSLQDMFDHACEAVEMLGVQTREELKANRMLQLALTRLMEIVGEAANRVTQEAQHRYPYIPWAQIIGMRNRLIHGYDVIDQDVLWNTVTTDLPPLIEALEEIVGKDK